MGLLSKIRGRLREEREYAYQKGYKRKVLPSGKEVKEHFAKKLLTPKEVHEAREKERGERRKEERLAYTREVRRIGRERARVKARRDVRRQERLQSDPFGTVFGGLGVSLVPPSFRQGRRVPQRRRGSRVTVVRVEGAPRRREESVFDWLI